MPAYIQVGVGQDLMQGPLIRKARNREFSIRYVCTNIKHQARLTYKLLHKAYKRNDVIFSQQIQLFDPKQEFKRRRSEI